MQSSAINSLQKISQQTYYLKNWNATRKGKVRDQNNCRSVGEIHSESKNQYVRRYKRTIDSLPRKSEKINNCHHSVVYIEPQFMTEFVKMRKMNNVSFSNNLPSLPRKIFNNKYTSVVIKKKIEEQANLDQIYNTVNLYQMGKYQPTKNDNPESSLKKEENETSINLKILQFLKHKKLNPKLRYQNQIVRSKKHIRSKYAKQKNDTCLQIIDRELSLQKELIKQSPPKQTFLSIYKLRRQCKSFKPDHDISLENVIQRIE